MTDRNLVSSLLARQKYVGGRWLDTGINWSPAIEADLRVLCAAGADIEKSADALGRSPTSLAHRARHVGLELPATWAKVIAPPRKLVVPKAPRIQLAYPYIVKRRDEHADLFAVNNLVPRGLPGREDVCQEIMLAIWEGKVTLDQLKENRGNVRAFVRSFTSSNYESGGYAISLDQPMHDGRSWHDVLLATPTA